MALPTRALYETGTYGLRLRGHGHRHGHGSGYEIVTGDVMSTYLYNPVEYLLELHPSSLSHIIARDEQRSKKPTGQQPMQLYVCLSTPKYLGKGTYEPCRSVAVKLTVPYPRAEHQSPIANIT